MPLLAVFTTVSNEAQAEELATGAVELRLAACVQIEPVKSTYRWKGHIERDDEIRLMFKTTTDRHEALMQWLAGIHPYEVPAIFALPVQSASEAYVDWVCASL